MNKSKHRGVSVFLSYCHEDIDRNTLDLLIKEISDTLNNEVNFHYDQNEPAGTNLHSFMDLLHSVDCILVILTPSYKAKIDKRKNSGVLHELQIISGLIEEPTIDTKIIPILFSGTQEESCPQILKNIKSLDFSNYLSSLGKDKTYFIPNHVRTKHNAYIENICSIIRTLHVQNSKQYQEKYKALLKLLIETKKHEDITGSSGLSKEESNHIIVKTKAYKNIISQKSYILTGRKGSGKSTIVDAICEQNNNNYKFACKINVNLFSLSRIYADLNSPHVKSNLHYVISPYDLLSTVWYVFIYLCCIEVVLKEYQMRQLSKEQAKFVKGLIVFFYEITNDHEYFVKLNSCNTDKSALFEWSLQRVLKVIEQNINEARSSSQEEFSYDIAKSNSTDEILNRALSLDIIKSINNIAETCKKKFIISLDGFDTKFEHFRKDSLSFAQKDIAKRTAFENDFLAAFLKTVLDIKNTKAENILHQNIDLCVMVPQDRFRQVRRMERDSYIYRGKYSDIHWTGVELAIMLRKRLEVMNDYYTNPNSPPFERLTEIFKKSYPHLPLETSTMVDNKTYSHSLFIDVLRHTFWRPRGILSYFAGIISLYDEFEKNNWPINKESISKCISDITDNIIQDEFIGEFENYFLGIEVVLDQFRNNKQIIPYNLISQYVGPIDFNFIGEKSKDLSIYEKIEVLYEIGFLGIRLNEHLEKKYKPLLVDLFCFSEGHKTFKKILRNNHLDECVFVVHPIFCEFLDLDTSDQDLTLNFTEMYLVENEILGVNQL